MTSVKREYELLDQIDRRDQRIAELAQEHGMLKIAYEDKSVLLASCENSLKERDAENSSLKARVADLDKKLNDAIDLLDIVGRAKLFHKWANPSLYPEKRI